MRPSLRVVSILILLLSAITAANVFAGPPAHMWGKRGGSVGGNEIGRAVAVLPGTAVFVGQFSGNADIAGVPANSVGGTDGYVCELNATTGVIQTLSTFGGTGNESALGVAVDASGNKYVAGFFSGTASFGGGINLVSSGSTDAFVAKYLAGGGGIQWARQFSSTGTDLANAVAVDGMGNVYVTGQFSNTATILGNSLISAGNTDIFLLKLNSAGGFVSHVRFGSAGFDNGLDVAVDPANDVILTGLFTNTVNFGGVNLISAGGDDMVLAKYTPGLVHLWSQRFGGTSGDLGYSLATNAGSEIYLAGAFMNTINFGGSNLISSGSYDASLAKFSSAGGHIWSRSFGGMNLDTAHGVAVDAADNVFITGDITTPVDFGAGPLGHNGSDEIYIASYNGGGAHRWSQSLGNTSFDIGYGIATDAAGNVYATGQFTISLPVGAGLVSLGADDVYMAKFSGQAATPTIISIYDIPNDQGRQVKIRFERSAYDQAGLSTAITSYEAYRKDEPGPSITVTRDALTLSEDELAADGWSFVGSAPAHGESSYGFDVPTIGDSTVALGPYNSTFFIRAATTSPLVFFDSAEAAGYSLDNLAPGVPDNFIFTAGDLTWDESEAADFDYFTVYGSNIDAFGSAVVVDYSTSPDMDVSGSPYIFYYVTATDFSGNEGKPAKVNTLSGAGGSPKAYVLSLANYPNPFNPRTTVSYTVPSRGHVSVRVYDARGAHVATLVDGEKAVGAYSVDWNPGVAISSGVYFARIEHSGATRSKKMVLLK